MREEGEGEGRSKGEEKEKRREEERRGWKEEGKRRERREKEGEKSRLLNLVGTGDSLFHIFDSELYPVDADFPFQRSSPLVSEWPFGVDALHGVEKVININKMLTLLLEIPKSMREGKGRGGEENGREKGGRRRREESPRSRMAFWS
jgi:hypothetical protein